MTRARIAWLLLGILCLASCSVLRGRRWDKYIDAGGKAYEQGKYAEAEKQFTAALKEAENFGEQDPRLATSLNNLALVYHDQGKYAEAEPLYRRSLAIKEKALGSEHPRVATSLNNLGELYREQSKYAEAEPLYRRSLAIWEKALGPEHPRVATSLNNLGLLYDAQGKYAEAEPLYKRSLAIWEKALGPEHPDVATRPQQPGGCSTAPRASTPRPSRFTNARWRLYEKALGPEHPRVATSLNNLAVALRRPRQVCRDRAAVPARRWRS